MSGFVEWWADYYRFSNKYHRECAKAAWDHQQSHIDELEAKVAELEDAISEMAFMCEIDSSWNPISTVGLAIAKLLKVTGVEPPSLT